MIFIKRFLAQLMLASEGGIDIPWTERIYLALLAIIKSAPIVFLLNIFNAWFVDNQKFFVFMLYTLIANMIAGVWRHRKEKSFSWEKFFEKNFQMWIIIIMTYPLLEMLHIITGDNMISDVFTVIIQLSTLLYPGSKLLKNMYIISNKQFPPTFIMERLYKFQKTGNPDTVFRKDHMELTDQEKEDFEDTFKKK